MADRLLDDYSHIADQWGWTQRILPMLRPRRTRLQGLRWILLLASVQFGLCLGSNFTIRTLESSARLKHRMERMVAR